MDASLGEHGIILELRFTQRRAVASNQHQFGWSPEVNQKQTGRTQRRNQDHPEEQQAKKKKQSISSAQGTFSASRSSPRKDRERSIHTFTVRHRLKRRLVTECVLARLDGESKPGVYRFSALCCLGFLCWGHCWLVRWCLEGDLEVFQIGMLWELIKLYSFWWSN